MRHKSGIFDKGIGSFASMMQAKCRTGGAYCRSQEPASGRDWMLGIPKWNGRNGYLKQTCRANLLSAVSRFANIGSWKAGSHTSHRLLLKAQSWLSAIAWQMGKIFPNKPWRPQLRDQTYASLHETQIRNLRQRDGIFCKLNINIIQSWWSVLPLSATLSFW